jgi:hypothetical protein
MDWFYSEKCDSLASSVLPSESHGGWQKMQRGILASLLKGGILRRGILARVIANNTNLL